MAPGIYPSEQPGEWWEQFENEVGTIYAEVGRVYPDHADRASLRWHGRTAYDIGAGLEPEASKAKHLRELRQELGLPFDPSTITRLHVDGPFFRNEANVRWNWQGMTGFSLAYDLAEDAQGSVERFLDFAAVHRVTLVRVLTTAVNLFDLPPLLGRVMAERVLRLAHQRGLYVELVGLADTALRTFDHHEHLARLGELAARHPNCLIEVANEPNHPTQESRVADPVYLAELAQQIPTSVLHSLGASHGADDENRIYWIGDYATVHGERKGGWDSVRHTREMQAIRDDVEYRMPVVNDEPDRNLSPDQHLGMALLTSLYSLGDTFHYAGGLRGQIPSGDELTAFQARQRGWAALPPHWFGSYCNNSTVSCHGAIESWDTAQIVRLYGALDGDAGYVVGLGVQSDASIRWNWRRELLVNEGQARLWRIAKP